ncbi:MAG: molecular chaperone HtpG [Lachnospiraceae bacterium]|nr:molecular chaperone HtpG [Lachnospiraceae bacterium]
MSEKRGTLSISSENIFPIIKKWMYSDQDIFIRELISNGCDAITKLKKLEMMGEYEAPESETGGSDSNMLKGRIEVVCDDKGRTLTFIDNGIGMSMDEVDKYINQIAFSGATDFIEKYKDKSDSDQIIGHFGLGFYSAFMVSDKVEIDSKSYAKDAAPVHWECEGAGTDYTMTEGSYEKTGTKITLHISDDCLKYCNEYTVREVLNKYCSFMPQEIYLSKAEDEAKKAEEAAKKAEEAAKKADQSADASADTADKGSDKGEEKKEEPKPINETMPLWAKTPSDCTEEEYKEFYRKVFHDYREPLFWIHLNMDYPFNLKGILYFPKINIEYESAEGVIKLYNNQVFVADNIKEVIPEFLMLLKGVIDCPDLPLNVSRSALQNDGFVTKISDYITKKVAEKLSGLCKTDRENYEKYWDDISPFVKYGVLRNDKFADKINDYILFKDIYDKYTTLPEALDVKPIDTEDEEDEKSGGAAAESKGAAAESEEAASESDGSAGKTDGTSDKASDEESKDGGEKSSEDKKPEVVDADGNVVNSEDDGADEEEIKEKKVYYVTDATQQSQYINMFKSSKMTALVLTYAIDQPFIQRLEMRNQGVRFLRIDAEVEDVMRGRTSKKEREEFEEKSKDIEKALRKTLKRSKLVVKLDKLKNKKVAAMLTTSEEKRRMDDMMKMYSMGEPVPESNDAEGETLILNVNHPLVEKVMEKPESEDSKLIEQQLYDLALLSNKQLSAEEMTKFIQRSNDILMKAF